MCSSNFTKDGTTYKVVGNHSNALIFIHGVGIQSDVWQPQIEYFSKTYRVIVYDLLGHGESPVQKKTTLDDYVKQLYLLSKKLLKVCHYMSFISYRKTTCGVNCAIWRDIAGVEFLSLSPVKYNTGILNFANLFRKILSDVAKIL